MCRTFMALLLAVSLIGAMVNDASAGLTAEIAAVTNPCCEGDCPDEPACGASCGMMARSGLPVLLPLQTLSLAAATDETAAKLLIPDKHPLPELALDGLRRPPRI